MPDDAFQWQEWGLVEPPDPVLPPPHALFQLGLPTISKALLGAGPDWTVSLSIPITLLGAIDESAFQAMLVFEDLRGGATSDTGFPAAPPALGSGWPDGADTFAFLTSPGGSGDYTIDVTIDAGPYAGINDLDFIGVQIRHHLNGGPFVDALYQVNTDGDTGRTVPANGWFYFGEKVANTPDDTDEPYALAGPPTPPYLGWSVHEDYTPALVALNVSYGAPDAVSKPRPLQADVDLAIAIAGPCPPAGRRFRLALSEGAAAGLELDEAVLFTGEVTDPTIDPRVGLHRITAAGALGRNYRRTVTALGWPVQDDATRAERIMDRAGVDVGVVTDGTVDLAAPESDDTAGSLLDRVTGSSGGAVVEQPAGTVDYLGPDHRRGSPVKLTLDAANITNALTWSQHVDDILNELEVTYAGGTVFVQDPASIERDDRGVYPGKIGTDLVSHSDAYSLGQLVIGRRSEPVWQLPDLEVDLMRMVDDELRGQLLELRHGDLIEVTNIPAPHAYTGDVKLYVEGWTTTVTRPRPDVPWRWRLVLKVSDRTLSGVSIRWVDVDPGLSWADVDPSITWFDVATIIDDEQLLGEPDSAPDLLDGGTPGDTPDRVIDGGTPGDTPTTIYDGGTP